MADIAGILPLMPDNPAIIVALTLMVTGIGIKTAIFPLHGWLPDAYTYAPSVSSSLIAPVATKVGTYVLVRILFFEYGVEFFTTKLPVARIVILFASAGIIFGSIMAIAQKELKRMLAYHIISQVGYMVVGAGIGTEMAVNGAAAHAFCHILYKGLLFMGAGVVLETTGRSKLTELGGLYKAMPVTVWLYMIGAFSISGFPLFNGFISKSMVVAAAEHAHRDGIVLLLLLASVGTFLHTGLKLPYFTWYSPSAEKTSPAKPPGNMIAGMTAAAFLCILLGVAPGLLYVHLPFDNTYQPFTAYHLVETTQILLATFVGFWLLRDKLAGEVLLSLDTDWFYRRSARIARKLFVDTVDNAFGWVDRFTEIFASTLAVFGRNPVAFAEKNGEDEYDPDRLRPSTKMLISGILFSFLILTLSAFFAIGAF